LRRISDVVVVDVGASDCIVVQKESAQLLLQMLTDLMEKSLVLLLAQSRRN